MVYLLDISMSYPIVIGKKQEELTCLKPIAKSPGAGGIDPIKAGLVHQLREGSIVLLLGRVHHGEFTSSSDRTAELCL